MVTPLDPQFFTPITTPSRRSGSYVSAPRRYRTPQGGYSSSPSRYDSTGELEPMGPFAPMGPFPASERDLAAKRLWDSTIKWNAAAANAGSGAAPTPDGGNQPGDGGSAAAPAAGGAPPMDPFDAAIQHVNEMYDAQHKHLDQLVGGANAGIDKVGAETQTRLGALGKEAKATDAGARKNIRDTYSDARKGVSDEYVALLADLKRQGAGTQALGAEERARLGAVNTANARLGATSDRYSQLLQQSLNDRQALSTQTTGNAKNDVGRAQQSAEYAAQQQKADAIYKIQAERAAQAAAAARGGGGGGGGRGGGVSLTDAEIGDLLGFGDTKPGSKSYDKYFEKVDAEGNIGVVNRLNIMLDQLNNGRPASEILSEIGSKGWGPNNTNDKQKADIIAALYGINRDSGATAAKKPSKKDRAAAILAFKQMQ